MSSSSTTAIRAILIAYASMILFALADNVRGPLYPEILQAFQLTNALGAWYFAIASMASVGGALVAKAFIRSRGYRWTLLLGLACLAVALAGASLAPQFFVLLIFVAIYGASVGILGVVQNALVSKAAPEQRLLQFQSGLHSLYGFASFMAPLFAALTYSFLPSWRLPFAVLSGAVFLLFLQVLREGEMVREVKESEAPSDTFSSRDWPQQMPAILFWGCVLSLYVVAEIFVATRLAQYLRDVQGFTFNGASVGVSIFFGGLFLGRILFVFLRWRASLLFQLQLALGFTSLLLVLGLIKPLAFLGNHWLLALSGFTMGPIYPMTMTWVSRRFKSELETTVTVCLVLSGIFNLIMHSSVGLLTDKFGIAHTFWFGPIVSILALFLVFRYRMLGEQK